MTAVVEQINIDLRQHQTGIEDWQFWAVVKDLHIWADRFVDEFKLQTSTPAITIERLRSDIRGRHRLDRNGLGLRHELAISQAHIETDDYWQVLGTELHELLHAEQEEIGKSGRRNYHNRQFRDRTRQFGLIVDERGHQQYVQPPSPFLDLLGKYGVKTPDLPQPEAVISSSSQSKLKPWICECKPRPIHIQVAIRDLKARCLKCGQMFRPKVMFSNMEASGVSGVRGMEHWFRSGRSGHRPYRTGQGAYAIQLTQQQGATEQQRGNSSHVTERFQRIDVRPVLVDGSAQEV